MNVRETYLMRDKDIYSDKYIHTVILDLPDPESDNHLSIGIGIYRFVNIAWFEDSEEYHRLKQRS